MISIANVFFSPLLSYLIHFTKEAGLFCAVPTSIFTLAKNCKVTSLKTFISVNNAWNQSIQIAQTSTYSALSSQPHKTPILSPPSPEGSIAQRNSTPPPWRFYKYTYLREGVNAQTFHSTGDIHWAFYFKLGPSLAA